MTRHGEWLADVTAPVDRETWCYVASGDPMLTRRANGCPGATLLRTHRYGTDRLGRYVRHHEYAAALATGAPADVRRIAQRLAQAREINLVDRIGIALVANERLALPLIVALADQVTAALIAAAEQDVAATGGTVQPPAVTRLLRAPLYVAAGLSASEIARHESDGTFDEQALSALAALRGAALGLVGAA